MQETPRQLLAPALPGIIVQIVKDNCSEQDFLTISKLRDKVVQYTESKLGERPTDFDIEALKRRIRYSLQTAQDIDPAIRVKYHQTQRKTSIIKIYYHA